MIQFKDRLIRNKLVLGGAAIVGVAASVYFYYSKNKPNC